MVKTQQEKEKGWRDYGLQKATHVWKDGMCSKKEYADHFAKYIAKEQWDGVNFRIGIATYVN